MGALPRNEGCRSGARMSQENYCCVCGVVGEHSCRLQSFLEFVNTPPWVRAERSQEADVSFLRSIGVATEDLCPKK